MKKTTQKMVKVTIDIPDTLFKEMEYFRKKMKLTRSEFVGMALLAYLRKYNRGIEQ